MAERGKAVRRGAGKRKTLSGIAGKRERHDLRARSGGELCFVEPESGGSKRLQDERNESAANHGSGGAGGSGAGGRDAGEKTYRERFCAIHTAAGFKRRQ